MTSAPPFGIEVRLSLRECAFFVPGSCIDYQSPCEHQFQIRGNKHVLNARYPHCAMPSTGDFDPDVRVVVEGFVAVNRAEVVATTPVGAQ